MSNNLYICKKYFTFVKNILHFDIKNYCAQLHTKAEKITARGYFMTEYVIETKNLTKKYKDKTVVDNINMNVEKGKIYGLLGKNGAGKTTTMCMLLNLASKTGGEILLFNNAPNQETYRKIGSIIETPGFYENLTAEENLKIISKIRKNYSKERINEILELVSLDNEKNKKYRDYSLGMKQRLGIASAIMHKPDLLILDEPINGLDPIGIKEIRDLLKKLSIENNTTILISSHILSEIENIADVIGIIDNGKLITELNKDELYNKLNKSVDFEVSDTGKAQTILEKIGMQEHIDYQIVKIKERENIRLYTNLNLRDSINEIFVRNGIKVQKINLTEENLEEFFTRIISTESEITA